jgi:hypothetical protein
MCEEELLGELIFTENYAGFHLGYLNQQLVKLNFCKTFKYKYYFCLDSDFIFLKDFVEQCFFQNEVPILFFTSDIDLNNDGDYMSQYGKQRLKYIREIHDFFDMPHDDNFSIHGITTIFSNVLMELEKYIKLKDLNFKQLLRASPLEFTWHHVFTRKLNFERVERETIVKTYHMKHHHLKDLRIGVTNEMLANDYIGIVVNSNFARPYNVYDNSKGPEVYNKNLSYFFRKLCIKVSRLIR